MFHHRLIMWLSIALLIASFGVLHGGDAAKAAAKPNLVFVRFDELGWCQPPSYWAGSEFKLPKLDRLAREGMRFTDAHSAAAVCTPPRYGVLTGRYPSRLGQFGVLTTYSPPSIPPEAI